MANFTPKPNWKLAEDVVYYKLFDGNLRLKLCFASFDFPNQIKYYLKVHLPVKESSEVVDTYLNYLNSIGLFDLVDSYGFETVDETDYIWLVAKPNTTYRQLVLVGTLLRGIGCFPYVAVNFHELCSYELEVAPTRLFLLSWGKVFVKGVPYGFTHNYGPYNLRGHGLGIEGIVYGDMAKSPICIDLKRYTDKLYQHFAPTFDTEIETYLISNWTPLTKNFVKEFFNV
jgi:hypothetical protein